MFIFTASACERMVELGAAFFALLTSVAAVASEVSSSFACVAYLAHCSGNEDSKNRRIPS